MSFTARNSVDRVIRTGLCASLAFALAGCSLFGSDEAPTLECFPEEAQKWIYRGDTVESDDGSRSREMEAPRAVLYFDRSVSMLGYLNGGVDENRPLEVLINNLSGVISRSGSEAVYAPFGRRVETPRADARGDLLEPKFYLDCKNGKGQSCDSNLRSLFEQISNQSDELAVVVTDLWYEEEGNERAGAVALQDALTEILVSGRSVSIYGIDAPFTGPIYDVPAGGNAVKTVRHQGTHPLYLFVVGTKGDVFEFDRQLSKTVGVFEAGLKAGTIHRSVFTVDPGPLRPVRKQPVSVGNDGRLAPTSFETYPATGDAPQLFVQQLELGLSRGGSETPGELRPTQWIAPREDDFLPNTVHAGPLRASVKVWNRSDEDDACSRWRKTGDLATNVEVNEQYTLELSPEKLRKVIRRDGVYLISGQLERETVMTPNPANEWAQAWSLSSSDASRIPSSGLPVGRRFGTLNLSQVIGIMENALQTATERTGGGIVGFTILIKAKS